MSAKSKWSRLATCYVNSCNNILISRAKWCTMEGLGSASWASWWSRSTENTLPRCHSTTAIKTIAWNKKILNYLLSLQSPTVTEIWEKTRVFKCSNKEQEHKYIDHLLRFAYLFTSLPALKVKLIALSKAVKFCSFCRLSMPGHRPTANTSWV
jgi:hypothetical protein